MHTQAWLPSPMAWPSSTHSCPFPLHQGIEDPTDHGSATQNGVSFEPAHSLPCSGSPLTLPPVLFLPAPQHSRNELNSCPALSCGSLHLSSVPGTLAAAARLLYAAEIPSFSHFCLPQIPQDRPSLLLVWPCALCCQARTRLMEGVEFGEISDPRCFLDQACLNLSYGWQGHKYLGYHLLPS